MSVVAFFLIAILKESMMGFRHFVMCINFQTKLNFDFFFVKAADYNYG